MGWFLLRFADLLSVRALQVISKNLTRFCWLTCRRQKLVQSKILQQGLFVLVSPCHFRQALPNTYCLIYWYANEQVATFIKQSLEKSHLPWLVQKMNKREKFLWQQQITEFYKLLDGLWNSYCYCGFPDIREKSWRRRGRKPANTNP